VSKYFIKIKDTTHQAFPSLEEETFVGRGGSNWIFPYREGVTVFGRGGSRVWPGRSSD
jgi:hypothetical protein